MKSKNEIAMVAQAKALRAEIASATEELGMLRPFYLGGWVKFPVHCKRWNKVEAAKADLEMQLRELTMYGSVSCAAAAGL